MGCGRVFFGPHRRLLGEKHALGGKHRTEVTEGTEGGGLWRVFVGRHRRILGEKHALGGKHRTKVTESTEGNG